MDPKIIETLRKYALVNAAKFGGRAQVKSVMGKLMAEHIELRPKAKDLKLALESIIKEINKMSLEEQKKELLNIWPEGLKPETKAHRKDDLPSLPEGRKGAVVTRLPPEPNGYLHIGHAISFFFNYYYAKKYEGKLWLRFEDTNPKNEAEEYYINIYKDLEWLGIDWDYEKRNSDDMELFYKYGKQLLEMGYAYICRCEVMKTKELRMRGIPCTCRSNSVERNIDDWERMLSGEYSEGMVVWRLKGDMRSQNFVMRDPTLFRIIMAPHPIYGNDYVVWPTYDFAAAIEDAICGVTHVLRSNEFSPRGELQNYIRSLLNLKNPVIKEYSRFSIVGTPTSKRKIKELLQEKILTSWADIRLATLKALQRRGILPQAIFNLAKKVGLTVSRPVLDWKLIISENKKLLDPIAERYFFVADPVKLIIEDAPPISIKLKKHPQYIEKGFREIRTGKIFFISADDAAKIKKGSLVRLKDLFNVQIFEKNQVIYGQFMGREVKDLPKIQWVAGEGVPAEIEIPKNLFSGGKVIKDSLLVYKGLAERDTLQLDAGQIIQFERIGFCRLDRKSKNKLIFCFSESIN